MQLMLSVTRAIRKFARGTWRACRVTPCRLSAVSVTMATMAGAAVTAATPIASIHQYAGLALSPNGAQVVAVESGGGRDTPNGIVVRDATDGTVMAVFDPCTTCSYADPVWSPNSKSLAFVASDSATRTSRMWVAQGKALQPTVSFDGLLAKPRYSPDGRTLAVLATEHPSKEAGAFSAGASQIGDLDALPLDERRIAVLDSSPHKLRLVSPADRYVYEYDWAPDGKGFAVTDAVGDPDGEWYVARLEFVDLATGTARTLTAPTSQVNIRWSLRTARAYCTSAD